jgi:hypothetical protein
MSNLAIQDLYDRKIDEASEMSDEQLADELKEGVSNREIGNREIALYKYNNFGKMNRDTMIDIVAYILTNAELRDAS